MRKTLMLSIIVFLAVLLSCGLALAITGLCSSCHTMHNSQNGAPVTFDDNAHAHLLRASCIGCHTGNFGNNYPKVDIGTNSYLAGGSFNTSVATSMAKRHDVTDLFNVGDTDMNGTPGLGSNSVLNNVSPTNLNCAGETGCHGRHDANSNTSDSGIDGFHHKSVTPGYRFLWIGTSANNGTPVLGTEETAYEAGGATDSAHNVYSADSTGTAGISKYCAQCHGEFHGTTNTVSAGSFIRHPTDWVLGSGGANWSWSNFNWGNQTNPYNNTPLAFTDFTSANFTNVNTNTPYLSTTDYGAVGAVMCLSCHRAHGSQYDYILRWDYTVEAGNNTSGREQCLACHYTQRGSANNP
jgi:predicted CXXCH cytochrome family protein